MKIDKRVHIHPSYFQLLIAIMCTFGLLNSCVTTKKTTYLQEYKKSEYPTEYIAPEAYRIQPDDNLFIRVTTPDPQWSAIFNTGEVGGTSFGRSEQAIDLLSYRVKLDGTVEIPYLGSINVAGKTVAETKKIMEALVVDYVSDAEITVKLVNNYVSILGEVNQPGRYLIYKEQLNIFEAMAMAGDMAQYSNRQQINIVRQTDSGTIVKEFNLTDKNIIDSEFYYVKPNDVIYARPMKGKFFGMAQFPYSVLLSTITTFLLVLNYIQK